MTERRSKYGVRTDAAGKAARTIDGILFASKAEARRYEELRLMLLGGAIIALECQPSYGLHVGNTRIGTYRGDFTYLPVLADRAAGRVIEDVKGVRTPIYRWKKKHMLAEYGIKITEVE